MKRIAAGELAQELISLAKRTDHGAAPIVFFDADHTLWAADVADLVYRALISERAIRPAGGAAIEAMCMRAGVKSVKDPHDNATRLLDAYLADRVPDDLMLVAQTVCYAGHSPASIRALAMPLIERTLLPQLHEGMRELIGELRAAGIGVRVISGSPQMLVELAVEALGIATGEVAGIVLQRSGDRFGSDVDRPITFLDGKVHAMDRWLDKQRALAAFGDSPGDIPMLERAHVRVAVNPRPALRDRALKLELDRWRLLVPPKTVSGTKVIEHTTNRAIG